VVGEINADAALLSDAERRPLTPVQPSAEEHPAEQYRGTAEKLRQLAKQIRFDFGRQQQLLSLADAFDRLADRKENAVAGLSPPPT